MSSYQSSKAGCEAAISQHGWQLQLHCSSMFSPSMCCFAERFSCGWNIWLGIVHVAWQLMHCQACFWPHVQPLNSCTNLPQLLYMAAPQATS